MLTRAEVEELLPLYAGDDLEPELRLRVEEALEADPSLRAALGPWSALERLLGDALVPPAGAVAVRPASRVQCPVCKDALFRAAGAGESSAVAVVCARCATPHHAGCFASHGQCAVLGCGSARALGDAAAIPLRPCAACARETAAEAPFCSWCGASQGEGVPGRAPAPAPAKEPASAEPAPVREVQGLEVHRGGGAGRLLAAATLLLACGLSLGALLGVQQSAFLEALARESARVQVREAETELPALLGELQAAQRAFREEDLDGDGVPAFAPDAATLLQGLARAGRNQVYPHLTQGRWRPWFALAWGPPRDAESGLPVGNLAQGYQGWVLPRFAPQELGGVRGGAEHRLCFDEARVWEEAPALAGGATGALLERWRQVLLATPGVLAVGARPFELELSVGEGTEPARLLRAVPRDLRATLVNKGLGLRISAPGRELAFYGAELGGDE